MNQCRKHVGNSFAANVFVFAIHQITLQSIIAIMLVKGLDGARKLPSCYIKRPCIT